jgi:nicotinate-nucleotide pyrophosphorylase (carboxylating)
MMPRRKPSNVRPANASTRSETAYPFCWSTMTRNELAEQGRILSMVETALAEDLGLGDLTSEATIDEHVRTGGEFLCKGDGIIAGLAVARLVFQSCDESVTMRLLAEDGSPAHKNDILAVIEGPARALLCGERVALNFLQRMSGIATLTRRYVEAVSATKARITDTRKTAPGIRLLDKMAVRLGGGVNHRFGLDDMILIKDNHIAAAGSLRLAVTRCIEYVRQRRISVGIEVETTSLDQVREALACAGIQRIMLDNFPLLPMKEAVDLINGRVEVEASGGITLQTVRAVAETGVDFISVGALTHSVQALDISLELIAGAHTPHA